MAGWRSSAGRVVAAALVMASAGVIVKAATLADRYQAEMQEIQAQMSDPQAFMRMSDAQREALMARLEKVTERLGQEAQAALNDPSVMQRKQDAFGCQHLTLVLASPTVSGTVSCGKDVGRLTLTGTRAAAGR